MSLISQLDCGGSWGQGCAFPLGWQPWWAPLCPLSQRPTAPCQPCPPGKGHVRGLPGTPVGPCPARGRLGWHWVWFPTLLLPLPGRVARAGRSGTAYSLVAPDEMPYVFDLHLFLGRPLVLAGAQEMPAGKADLVAGIGVAACPSWDTGHVAALVLFLASAGVCGLVVGIRAEGRYALVNGVHLGKMGCWGLQHTLCVGDADVTPPSSPWLLALLC